MNLLSVDVGHGHTKFVVKTSKGRRQDSFPSYAIPYRAAAAASAVAPGLRVVSVPVDGYGYRVGPDIELALPAHAERNRDDNYSRSPKYMALLRGAMHYAKCNVVDVLAVGLPLSTLGTSRETLQQALEGTHEVPGFDGIGTVQVTVKKVVVMAQPLGALFSAVQNHPSLAEERILVLDLGFHTLDVMAVDSMRVMSERMGAVPGGVAAYIDTLERSIAAHLRRVDPDNPEPFRVSSLIFEKALQRKERRLLKVGQGTFDLDEFRGEADRQLSDALEQARVIAGNSGGYTSLILAGGGAPLMRPLVSRHFPSIKEVVVLDDPQFSIATGYLVAAEHWVASSNHVAA